METDPDIWNVMTVNANASGMTRFVQFESTYNASSVVTVTDTGEHGAPYTFAVTGVTESTGPGSYLQVEMATTRPATGPYATAGTLEVHATNVPIVGTKTWLVRALFTTAQVPQVSSNAITTNLESNTSDNQEMFVPVFGSWNPTGGKISPNDGSYWNVVDAAQMQGKVRVVVAATGIGGGGGSVGLTPGTATFSVTLNSNDATVFPTALCEVEMHMPPPPFAVAPCATP